MWTIVGSRGRHLSNEQRGTFLLGVESMRQSVDPAEVRSLASGGQPEGLHSVPSEILENTDACRVCLPKALRVFAYRHGCDPPRSLSI